MNLNANFFLRRAHYGYDYHVSMSLPVGAHCGRRHERTVTTLHTPAGVSRLIMCSILPVQKHRPARAPHGGLTQS